GFKGVNERRSCDGHVHGFRIVAIRTTYRINYLTAQIRHLLAVKFRHPNFTHQTGYIRALTGPAGTGHDAFAHLHGCAYPDRGQNIMYRVSMASGLVVSLTKSITGPKYDHFGIVRQGIPKTTGIVFTLKTRITGLLVGLVLPGIIETPNRITGFDPFYGDLGLIGEPSLCLPVHDGIGQHSQ